MEKKIKIAIADDEQLFRKGIRFLLSRETNFDILFDVNNGQELIDTLDTQNLPDIILMDLKMPVLNGVEATKTIYKKHPTISIIALTSYSGNSFITNMIDIGASSYLLKSASPKKVTHTINEVYQKGFYYDNMVLSSINENTATSREENVNCELNIKQISKRELQVLECILLQLNTAEIAEKLHISPRTVEGHRIRLLQKTGSKNIAGLVIYAIQKELVKIHSKL